MIRRAYVDDLPMLQELERAANAPFRELGMYIVADDNRRPSPSRLRFSRREEPWFTLTTKTAP